MIALGYGSSLIVQELQERFNVRTTLQNILQSYIRSPSFMKRVDQIRATMAIEVNKHPIASKIARLDYILTGINECLKWRVHKTTKTDEGKIIQKELRRPFHALPALIREARAEVEGDPELTKKFTLYDLMREFEPENGKGGNGNGNRSKSKLKGRVSASNYAESSKMDLSRSGGPEIL